MGEKGSFLGAGRKVEEKPIRPIRTENVIGAMDDGEGGDGKEGEDKTEEELDEQKDANEVEGLGQELRGEDDEEGDEEGEQQEKVDISPEFQNSEELKLIQKEQTKREKASNLFSNLAFFVSREVPRESLELCITAFGGVMGWDGEGSPFKENDRRITHHVVDRPNLQKKYKHNCRFYVDFSMFAQIKQLITGHGLIWIACAKD